MDLSKEDWFVFEDNYGTSEEKAFVAYFKEYVKDIKDKYDKVYLVRNERQLAIYSFDGGERFEPDYLLFLHLSKQEGYEQLQIFIEPKGTHLVEKDSYLKIYKLTYTLSLTLSLFEVMPSMDITHRAETLDVLLPWDANIRKVCSANKEKKADD